jgi:sialate O-acetylesterase
MVASIVVLTAAALAASEGSTADWTSFTGATVLDAAPPAVQGFALSAALQDSMVLQRDVPAMVWGFALENTTVTTTFGTHSISSVADNTSVWRAQLPPMPATKHPQTITFKASSGETASLSDVLFGDVYMCGGKSHAHAPMVQTILTARRLVLPGQSNMQFSVGGNENASYYRAEANSYPDIR